MTELQKFVLAIGIIAAVTLIAVHLKPEPEVQQKAEWCEVGEVHDGVVSYASSDPQKELLVIARDGKLPLLLEKCN